MAPKRIVRKQSLVSKLKSYPLDLLLALNEQRELIDWDSHSETIALPLGLILTVVYFFIRLWQDNTTVENKQKYFDYDKQQLLKGSKYFNKADGSILPSLFFTLQFAIVSINVLNTLLFLLKTKRYSIFNKASISHTSSAKKVSRGGSSKSLLNLIPFWKSFSVEPEIESYWELNIWNPSKFSTYLFVSFPPFNILFLYLSQSSFKNLLFLSSTSLVLYFVIIRGYMILIEDKQVLFQETFDEYQRKFVNPKLSVAKREVAIDATHGPFYNSVEYYSPGRREKVFKTHDHKGRESIEAFDHGEFTPIKKPTPLRKSVLTPRRSRFSQSYNPSPLSRKSHSGY